MIKKILFLFVCAVYLASDDIVRSEKTSFYKIYKDIVISEPTSTPSKICGNKATIKRGFLSLVNP